MISKPKYYLIPLCLITLFIVSACSEKTVETCKKLEEVEYKQCIKDLAYGGNDEARFIYANELFDRENSQEQVQKAIRIYKELAAKGHAESQFFLGTFYLTGTAVPHDEDKAFFWFEMAADNDFLPALNNVAFMLLKGQGTKEDKEKALQLFQRAANLNSAAAFVNIGHIFKDGNGVEKNLERAELAFLKGIQLGSTEAKIGLATLYHNEKTLKDLPKAYALMRLGLSENTKLDSEALDLISDSMDEDDFLSAQTLYELYLSKKSGQALAQELQKKDKQP